MPQSLHDRWHELCARVGAFGKPEESDLTFEMISTMYAHPVREYHNLDHIADCLATFDSVRGLADNKDAVEFALWLHDSVFFAERSDNEERSADAAAMIAGLLGCRGGFAGDVRRLIMVTRHSTAERPARGDDSLLADVDLSILASTPERYAWYCEAIRREFAFADEAMFRAGRIAFLKKMLERDSIYYTPLFRTEREGAARSNLERELEEWERGDWMQW